MARIVLVDDDRNILTSVSIALVSEENDAQRSPEDSSFTRGYLKMDPLRHKVIRKDVDVSLTVTEFLLLQSLAIHPKVVKSRDQMMDVAYADQVYANGPDTPSGARFTVLLPA